MRLRFSVFLSLICLAISTLALAQTQSSSQTPTLADLARMAREKKSTPAATSLPTPESAPVLGATASNDSADEFETQVKRWMVRGDFDALEQAAEQARASKSRFAGGAWKLYCFYDALGAPPAGSHASDDDWYAHMAKLVRWRQGHPASVTARIAFAEANLSYGWHVRGGGYANTVKDSAWKTLHQQAEVSGVALKEAYDMEPKDPHLYFVLLEIAQTEGWDKPMARALLERAVAFEPGYYHYYRAYATYLQPKWYGEEREAEAFADEMYKRIGGEQGAFVYFEIATTLYCDCGGLSSRPTMSWPRIQEGYRVMERLYGATPLKLNRLALLSVLYFDRGVARQAFASIGDDWYPEIWHNKRELFDSYKGWAK